MIKVLTTLFAAGLLAGSSQAGELQPPNRPINEVVDHYIDAALKAEKKQAVGQVHDAGLIRRITLDLVGRIPAPVETKHFVGATDSNKREQLINRLMQAPDFIEQQATHFDTFISQGTGSVKKYLSKAFQEERNWQTMFRDLMQVEQAEKLDRDAVEFLKQRVKDTDRLTNDVSVAFFGINVSCAKCHDHPLVEDWRQDHFYGLKSFFNRTFESGGFIAEREFGDVSFKTTAGETRNAKLMFLTGTEVAEPEHKLDDKQRKAQEALFKKLAKEKKAPPRPKFSRREKLVEVAVQQGQNDFFARAIVNRIWHQYFGFGLVMPLDQMHAENLPSHPELIAWLARDLVSRNYDLRRLIRGLLMSKAYARSSQWSTDERPGERWFAVANVRPLTPLQLARSLSLASADPESLAGDPNSADLMKKIAAAAANANSGQFELPNENFQVSADEALFFSNSEEVMKRYLAGGLINRAKSVDKDKADDDTAVIQLLVQSILSREPTDDEVVILQQYLKQRSDRREQAVQQLGWALMSSSEFRFNH